MKTTTFDSSELGLLERDGFKLEAPNFASKTKGDTYITIRRLSSTNFLLEKEQGNTTKSIENKTLREALTLA